jgi:sRNA-binding carbon storage regulator CsrA
VRVGDITAGFVQLVIIAPHSTPILRQELLRNVDFLRLPMHPENATDREGVADRLFEAMKARLAEINRAKE